MHPCEPLRAIKPYQGGKPIGELKRELGLKKIIKLASNENALGTSPKAVLAMKNALAEINRYPDSNGYDLKQKLAENLGIRAEQLTLGNGSNDVLELLARAFLCRAEDAVIFSQYAFAIYALLAQALGVRAKIAAAQNYAHDLEKMAALVDEKTRLIFIANPNNPTGTYLENRAVYDFLKSIPKRIVIVIDQAYFEYLAQEDKTISWLLEFPNLVLTRTFSKAYGLAGARVGYAISSAKIADYLNRIRQPFNVNAIAQAGAAAALDDVDFLRRSVVHNQKSIAQFENALDDLGLDYLKSRANFIAVKVENSEAFYRRMLKIGIIVRVVAMKNFVRVSFGKTEENQIFLQALAEFHGR